MKKTLLLSSLVAACASIAQADDTKNTDLNVLFIDELTLRDQRTPSWGQDSLNGMTLALEKKKGIKVKAVNVYRSPVLAYEAVQKNAKAVDVVVGLRTAAQALMAKKAADQHDLPFISVMATSDKLLSENFKKTSIMMAARNSIQIKALLRELWPQKKAQDKVGLVVMKNCVYCDEMSKLMQNELRSKGIPFEVLGETLFQEPVPKSLFVRSTEFSHIGLFTDEAGGMASIALLKKMRYSGHVFGGDSWSINNIAPKNRKLYNGICLVNAVTHSKTRMQRSFIEEYKKKYKTQPTDLALLGYDTGIVLNKLATKCAKSKKSLKDCFMNEIGKVRGNGASGRIAFDRDGGRTESSLVIEKYGCQRHAS